MPEQGERHVGNAAVTALLQVLTMGFGALVALLILLLFGKTARTDGLLAAYGVYGLLLVLGQAFRTTVVPRIAEGRFAVELDRYLGGAVLLSAVAAVPLVLLADPFAALLTGDLGPAAHEAARSALVVLWIAAACQLVAGVLAAALAEQGDFLGPGAGYVASGPVALVLVALLEPALGTDAVAWALAAGSATTVFLMAVRLARRGWRPSLRGVLPQRGRTRAVLTAMLLGAVSSVVGQLLYVVSTAFAARIEVGAVTLYSYAFFAALLVMGATTLPAQIVLAGPVARGWDGRAASLERDTLAVLRTGLMLVAPVLALAPAIGAPVLALLFGDALAPADRRTIVVCFLVLGVSIAASLAQTVPLVAAFARSRYAMVGGLAALAGVAHVALSAAAVATGELVALAAAAAAANALAVAALCVVTFATEARHVLGVIAGEYLRLGAVAAAAFVPLLLAASWVGGAVAGLVAWAVGCALFVAVLRARQPYAELLGRLAGLVPRAAPAA